MKPVFKLKPKTKLRLVHNAKEIGIIAGGSFVGGAAYDGAKEALKKKPKATQAPLPNQLKHDFDWKSKAGWVGTIAAGDIIGEGSLDALKRREQRKNRLKKPTSGIETQTAIPGNSQNTMSAKVPFIIWLMRKPDTYTIARRNLRGKKPMGVPKVKKFEDTRRRTNLNPDKTEKFKNVAQGAGAIAAGAGTAYAAHKIGKAADITEKLQKHVGGLATHAHDKIAAHIDYVGHHAGEAAEQSTRTARAARRTITAYHPRAIGKMAKGTLKKVPFLKHLLSRRSVVTDLNVMKEAHPKGPEKKEPWIQRNGARIAGTAAGLGGAALFYKHFKPLHNGPEVTRGRGITKIAKRGEPSTKPVERKPKIKREPSPISEIKKIRKPGKRHLGAVSRVTKFTRRTNFIAQGRDSDGRMADKDTIVATYRKGKKIAIAGRRTGDAVQDIHDVIKGKPKDPKKKRVWEKSWFQTGALGLAGGVGILAHRKHAKKHGYTPMLSANRAKVTNLSAFMRDVAVKKLPESAQKDIAQVLPLKKGTKVAHYGMVPHELLGKADAHNLATARAHVKGMSPLRARRDVEAKPDKHILLLNDKIVDGHHHLAKAERGGITRSLPVLDLTPARFQLSTARGKVTDFAFMIHDPDFPILPQKQPKLPKGMKQRVPVAETRAQAIERLKATTALATITSRLREFEGNNGLGKIAAETIIDATTRGADIGPKKKRLTKAQLAANNADPDLSPTNNWTADPRAIPAKMSLRALVTNFKRRLPIGIPVTKPTPRGYAEGKGPDCDDHVGSITHGQGLDKFIRSKQLGRRVRTTNFYGTSDGVTKSWDTRGRADRGAPKSHWWTHSPTRNSVRVVHSKSEKGPRSRRLKKFHEKTSTHKAAIGVATAAAAGLGGLALHKHLKLRKLDKLVHVPGHTVSVINRKGQSPLYSRQEHMPAKTSPAVAKARTHAQKTVAISRRKKEMAVLRQLLIEFNAGG